LRFRWWSTSPNGAEFNFNADRLTADTTLYAVWYTPHNSPARIAMIGGLSLLGAVVILGNLLFFLVKFKRPD